jgi:adenylate cyclase
MILLAWLLIGSLGSLFLLSSPGRAVDLAGYDAALHLLPDPQQGDDILIVGIDDPSISAVGRWPWSRDIIADGLIDLRALGARHIVLDITFPDASPTTVDRAELEDDFSALLQSFAGDLAALSQALEAEQIGSAGTARALGQLQDEAEFFAGPDGFLADALTDRDRYLGNAIGAVGTAVVAVTWDRLADDQFSAYSPPSGVLRPSVGPLEGVSLPEVGSVTGAIAPIESQAAAVGFVNARVDPDGVKRRADLLVRSGDTVLPALGVVPLLLDGYTEVSLGEGRVAFSDGLRTLEAPLGPDGSLLLRWHRGQFEEGFSTLSFLNLIRLNDLTEQLVSLLRQMELAGYLGALPGGESIFLAYEEAQERRAQMTTTGDPQLLDQYVPRIETFLSDSRRIFGAASEQLLMDIVDQQPESEQLSAIRDDIRRTFEAGRTLVEQVTTLRGELEQLVDERTVFIGFTAASTTDIGVTPFEEEYVNIGLHATVLRTLRSGDALDRMPVEFGFFVFLAVMAVLIVAVELLPPRPATVIGLSLVLIQVAAVVIAMVAGRFYLPLAGSTIMTFVTFSLLTAVSYVLNERDKRQIRLAFEHYLAPAVISELLNDPQKLDIGGESRELTAIFTDIESFATAISKLPPSSVVELLGEYLKEMTRPVLDQRGTIDKYEGDAIVAFFGAPLVDPAHARHACEAAIRIRELEPLLNDRLVRSGLIQTPLRTRIGLHSGPMTVGNLGTDARLDYTIIGPEVNLASRLEHVNKQYGTYTILSEETFQAAGEGLLVRRMDRVRVVGIDRPVRLYELLGHAGDSTAALREAIDLFAAGLESFEARDWRAALARFETVLKIYPTDGPAKLFVLRCKRFLGQPVRASWDGVITLTEK